MTNRRMSPPPTHKLCIITTTMLTFGMGASTQALFARVGGGIYTKAVSYTHLDVYKRQGLWLELEPVGNSGEPL